MTDLIIGIDPGATGALGVIGVDGKVRGVSRLPVQTRDYGKGRELNVPEILEAMRSWSKEGIVVGVALERVNAMPAKGRNVGTTSMFHFGENVGMLRALCAGCFPRAPMHRPMPMTWKKSFGLVGKSKEASVSCARRLFPDIAPSFTKKVDEGLAEALLIAEWLRRELK